MLGAHFGIQPGLDFTDARGFKNEHIAEARLDEIVDNFVHENLVAGIDMTASDDFPGGIFAAGQDTEIPHQRIAGRENRVAVATADDFREGEKIQVGFFFQVHDDIFLFRAEVEVVTAADDQVEGANEQIGRRGFGGHSDDAVKRRLHRAGGNPEGLEEIGFHACGKNNRHDEDFDVFAEAGVFNRWHAFADQVIDMAHALRDILAVAASHGGAEFLDAFFDLGNAGWRQDIALVSEEFFRTLEVKFCLFEVARGEEKHDGLN